MTTSYLCVDENGFHSIILKHNFNDFTYLLSLDYTGAQFLGKFSYDEEYSAKGVFSYSYGSQEWEKKISSVMFDESSKYFKVETEDLFEFFNTPPKIKLLTLFAKPLSGSASTITPDNEASPFAGKCFVDSFLKNLLTEF